MLLLVIALMILRRRAHTRPEGGDVLVGNQRGFLGLGILDIYEISMFYVFESRILSMTTYEGYTIVNLILKGDQQGKL